MATPYKNFNFHVTRPLVFIEAVLQQTFSYPRLIGYPYGPIPPSLPLTPSDFVKKYVEIRKYKSPFFLDLGLVFLLFMSTVLLLKTSVQSLNHKLALSLALLNPTIA